jgi:hypothetical protein
MIASLTVLVAVALSPALRAQFLDGVTVEGALISIQDGILALETEDGPRELPLAQLQGIDFSTNKESGTEAVTTWVELVDGSRLAAMSYETTARDALIQLASGSQARIPLRAVRAIRFGPQDELQQGAWERIRQGVGRIDRIAIRKQQEIDYLEGIVQTIDPEVVNFELDGEVLPVRITKIEGVVYGHRGPPDQPPAILRLSTLDGSVVEAAEWSAGPDGVLVRTPAGLKVEYPYSGIRKIDFSLDKIVYLSQLEPVAVEWTPYIGVEGFGEILKRFYRPKKDRALARSRAGSDEGRLRVANGGGAAANIESYDRGISLHSRTRMIYKLPDGARRFHARAGIDASTRQSGHVRLVILGDGDELFATEVSGRGGPRDISVDLTGVRLLELFVDYGENQDVGDHLNLCNARIVK